MEKKRIFSKTFRSTQNFSELQCLVDNLVDFLELSMFNLNILFDEVGRGPGQNKNILLDTIYITFF